MSHVAELYARWLADYYLLATILLALSLIGIALQKQPARRLALAKSTLVSLILLAVLCAIPGWSVVHLLIEQQPQSVTEFHDEVPAQPAMIAERMRLQVTDAPPIAHEDIAAPVVNNDPLPQPPVEFHVPWPTLFAMTHLAGAACIVLWLTLGWIASTRLQRTAQPAPTGLVAVLNEVFGQTHASTQRPQLLTHERIDVAVALGAWRPTILLPGRWIRSESQDHLRTVLAHESTHILNHDLQWVALTRMLFIALWANPLFWITRRWLRRDQEALADAAAAELTSRQRYAEQLVAWARDAHSRPALHLSSAVGLWEGPSQLRQRIAILLNDRFIVLRNCSRRWRLAAALTLIAGAIALSLVTIQPGQSQAAAKETEPKAPEVPVKPATGALTIRFEYDGTPPAPKELKEYGWRTKLDDRLLGSFGIEKKAGAKVFDESLVVGKDRGIANIFVYMRGKNIPDVATVDSVPHHRDERQGMSVPDKYKGPPATLSYRKGRYEPHALAFEWPRQLMLRNTDPKSECSFHYIGRQAAWNPLLKPGEERTVDVGPGSIPAKIAGGALPWLEGYVLPLGHPFFAVSDEHGKIRIDNLPPGKWEFQVWHERCGYVKTKNWTRGRFTLDVKPGDNDLGVVKLGPELLHEPEPSRPESTTSSNAPADEPKNAPVLIPRNQQANSIRAIVENEGNQPIVGAQAFLFRVSQRDSTRVLVNRKTTDEKGEFRFDHVVDVAKEFPDAKFPPLDDIGDELLQVIVIAPNRVPYSYLQVPQRIAQSGEFRKFNMWTAAPLRGRVTNRDGKPVVGALVSVGTGSFDRWEGALSARTDADGNYLITDAPPFDVQKWRDEQIPASRGEKTTNSQPAASELFRLVPPVLTIEHPDFAARQTDLEKVPGKKNVQLEPGMVITGRVVYRDTGEPAAGVRVCAATSLQRFSRAEGAFANISAPDVETGFGFFKTTVRTDNNGNYHFLPLPWSRYEVWAETPVYISASAKNVVPATGASKAEANLTLTKGGTVSIRLIDAETQKPIKVPAETRAEIYESSPRRLRPTLANKEGHFELRLAAGKHEFRIADVKVGHVQRWQGATLRRNQSTTVDIVDGQTAQVDMPVSDIYGTPLVDPKVLAQLADGPVPVAAEEKADKPNSRPTPNTLRGRAVDENGQPIAGAEVFLFRLAQPDFSRKAIGQTKTGADGRFQFDNVIDIAKEFPRGKFPAIQLSSDGDLIQTFVRSPGRVTASWMHIMPTIAQLGVFQTAKMLPAAKLRGRVTDPDGKPVAGALVSVGNGTSDRWEGVNSSRTDADGNYLIEDAAPFDSAEFGKQMEKRMPAFESQLSKEKQDNRDQKPAKQVDESAGDDVFIVQPFLTVNHPKYAVNNSRITKSPGTQDIQLEPAAVLEGRVTFADSGKSAAGVVVMVATTIGSPYTFNTATVPLLATTRTNADGKYRFASLKAGKYDVWADVPEWLNDSANGVVAAAGKSSDVPELKLTRGTTVSVRLVDVKTNEPIELQPRAQAMLFAQPLPLRITLRQPYHASITANKEGRFELHTTPGQKLINISGLDMGVVVKWAGVQPTEVTAVDGQSVAVDVPVMNTSGEQPRPAKPKESPSNRRPQMPRANTIGGRVVDEKGQPLVGAEVLLFRLNRANTTRKLVSKNSTSANGSFLFENVIDLAKEFPDRKLWPLGDPRDPEFVQIYAIKAGRVAQSILQTRQYIGKVGMNRDMSLVPAATLSGRVTGPDGKPVAGALASIGDSGFTHLEGIQSAPTNADGVYVIKDAAPFDIKEFREKEAEQRRRAESARGDKNQYYSLFMMRPVLTVVHPDFAIARTTYDKIPGTQDTKLEPAAIIEGQVVFGDSGKPAVGAVVHLSTSRSTDRLPTAEESMSQYSADTRTDANERFRFASLPPGSYDLSAEMPGWVNVGIDAFAAAAGKTSSPPNLILTKGGLISIRLVDAKTGKPIEVPRDARAYIAAHVLPLPKDARAAWEPYAPPNAEGRFELRSPPGKRAVFVFSVYVGEAVKWSGKVSLGENGAVVVDVAEGKTVNVDIPVVQGQPPVTGTFVPAGATVLRNVEAPQETIKRLNSVLEKDPKNTEALLNRAFAWSRTGEERKAVADYEQLITLDLPPPMRSLVYNNLAFILATSPDDSVRNGKRAVELAEKVQEMDKTPSPDMLDTLAAAYAEAGEFDRAIKTEQEAIKLAPERQLDEMRKNLKLYESNKKRRETLSPPGQTKP